MTEKTASLLEQMAKKGYPITTAAGIYLPNKKALAEAATSTRTQTKN